MCEEDHPPPKMNHIINEIIIRNYDVRILTEKNIKIEYPFRFSEKTET